MTRGTLFVLSGIAGAGAVLAYLYAAWRYIIQTSGAAADRWSIILLASAAALLLAALLTRR